MTLYCVLDEAMNATERHWTTDLNASAIAAR